MSPTGTGPTVQRAARLMASRALQQPWPASAAPQPSPGGAITTTAPVSVRVPRAEGLPRREGDCRPSGCFPVQGSRGGGECARG